MQEQQSQGEVPANAAGVRSEESSEAGEASAVKPGPPRRGGSAAILVAAGILLSRIAGLVRQRVMAHYLGNSGSADAFNAAFRIPNFLQNLFGEGVLSASLIPVYARLLAQEDREEARRVAGAIAALLGLVISALVLVGVLATPLLIDLIAPGFEGERKELTIRLVRILFPGAGLLVMSAWCLGVLNSHRKFLLPYAAPVLWNVTIIAALLWYGRGSTQEQLAVVAAWASVVGSALQLGIQLPVVLRLLGGLRLRIARKNEHVRTVVRNFLPVFAGRGVVQISAYIDTLLASLLPTGAVAAISYAQILYTLPVSLFGMSVSAAELPAMSSALGDERQVAEALRTRLNAGLMRIAFFVVPSAMAFLALGDLVAGAVYQTGEFTRRDSVYVWAILAGSAVGLLATTMGRLYSSVYYALRDTRTPLRYAMIRVALTIGLGYLFAIPLPRLLGLDLRWGAAGLTASAGLAGWIEFGLLRRKLNAKIGPTGLPFRSMAGLWMAAVVAAGVAWAIRLSVPPMGPIVAAIVVLVPFGLVYLALTAMTAVPEARSFLRRLAPAALVRRLRGRRG